MPEFNRLTPEQVSTYQPKRKVSTRRQEYEELLEYLQSLRPGEGTEVVLVGKEKRSTMRARLKRASEELGMRLVFLRTDAKGKILRFRVPYPNELAGEGDDE